MVSDTRIETHLELLRSDGCCVHGIAETKYGDTVILYSPVGRFDIHARILYAGGIATKRYVNDLSLHVTPIEGLPIKAWYLQYVRILGDKINRGFGSIMLRQLLLLAEREGIAYIDGRIQHAEHKEHAERLRHFYGKFGFSIDENGQLRWQNEKLAASSALVTSPPAKWSFRKLLRKSM
ncbi:hypothetical protein GZH47_28245 [Paenibacillus rhizovicinus]|uniref:N-acetyltransferase domain-containing protein n=1 Tax=Paenibacillus rhizovicinus TaxID=2704463 RepID=A0A6C0P6T5_9BACL|nr:hypothetical protein [Paenibacillus rhizovicinus]QHW34300.1 hypothetical protein GZH47_28245 [Paenibacillus rhizovicinus]